MTHGSVPPELPHRVDRPHDVVDAHHHLWVRARHPQTWMDPTTMAVIDDDFTEADFAALARPAGVTASVVVQSVHAHSETLDLLAAADASDVVRGVVGWVDLESPDVAERLAALRAAPGGGRLVGIRHQVESEPDPGFLARESVRRGLAAVGATPGSSTTCWSPAVSWRPRPISWARCPGRRSCSTTWPSRTSCTRT